MIDLAFGLQTYTIRKLMKKDFSNSMTLIKGIKVDTLELARAPFTESTAAVLIDKGIRVVSIQDKLRHLESHFSERIRFLKQLNIDIACVSVLPLSAIFGGKKQIDCFIKRINALAIIYRDQGVRLAFHHHDFEFKKIKGIFKFQLILDGLDPQIGIVMDTYWIKKSEEDILKWVNILKPRLAGVHLRDFKVQRYGCKKATDAPVGDGEIDFQEILGAIDKEKVYYVIEQNSTDPIVDIKKSLEYLRQITKTNLKGKHDGKQ